MAGIKIGVSDLTVKQITKDDATGLIFGTPVSFSKKLIKVSIDPQNTTIELSADDQIVETMTTVSEIKISLDVTDLLPSEKAVLLGQTMIAGVRSVGKADIAPYFTVAFKSKKSNGDYKYIKLHKVKFTESKDNFETLDKSPKFQNLTLEGIAIPTINTGLLMSEADAGETAFVGAGTWLA
jgi:phi13 family phage major tail protein